MKFCLVEEYEPDASSRSMFDAQGNIPLKCIGACWQLVDDPYQLPEYYKVLKEVPLKLMREEQELLDTLLKLNGLAGEGGLGLDRLLETVFNLGVSTGKETAM